MYLKSRIIAIFNNNRQVYGSMRMQKALEREKLFYSRSYIALLMKELGLRSAITKQFKVCTTDSKHNFKVSKNLLDRNFTATVLGEKMGL